MSKAVQLGTDVPDAMYAKHRLEAAVRMFGCGEKNDTHEESNDFNARAALLTLRALSASMDMSVPDFMRA
jgi:hypothetical protein